MIVIDILALVDRIEALVSEGWRIPFTMRTTINENAFFDIIDQMRVSVPQELKRANDLLEQRDQILAAAAEEAERLIDEGRKKAARLVDEHEIAAAARAEAETFRAQVEQEADQFRREADEYAVNTLGDLESRLSSLLRQASNGLSALRRKHMPATLESRDEGA